MHWFPLAIFTLKSLVAIATEKQTNSDMFAASKATAGKKEIRGGVEEKGNIIIIITD